MNSSNNRAARGFLLIALITSFACLGNGKENAPMVYIARNNAWNDFISQIASPADESPQDSFRKEIRIIQKFLKSHETEVRVGIYDVEVFKAIDQVRDRLQKADKDLATLRNELSYKETQKKLWK